MTNEGFDRYCLPFVCYMIVILPDYANQRGPCAQDRATQGGERAPWISGLGMVMLLSTEERF